jgi:hypothetical protein
MFYVKKLFSFLRRHFLQNSLFGFRQLPQLQKLAMVDLEGPPPYLAAASHHKVSCHHCGQVGCRFCSGLCFVCFCLLRFASPSSLFALLTCSFFLSSLSFLLLVGCRLFVGSRPRAAPFLGSSPWRCSFSVSFLGLGSAPARSLPWPQRSSVLRPHLGAPSRLLTSSPSTRCSARNLRPHLGTPLRPRLGAPPGFLGALHETCGLGPFLGLSGPRFFGLSGPRFFGLAPVLLLGSLPSTRCSAQNLWPHLGTPLRPRLSAPLGSLVLRTKPAASVPSSASAVLGSSASLRCSSSAPRLRLGAPHETFGLASVLLFGLALVLPLGSLVLRTKPAASVPSSASAVLGSSALLRCSSSPLTRCSARNLRPHLGAPPWLLGVLPLGSLVLRTKPAASVLLLGSLIP